MHFNIFQHLRAISTSIRGGSSSVSMSGQGYVSSALARHFIEYFIDMSLVDARIILVQALINLEGENPISPVGIEDQLTPVGSRPNQEDGPRKGRQCQETSMISFYI
ncbi:hypothetical protein ARMGADRAFT_1005049 [Armillaria gallica]|uniref:Uncharacterized protein n=1 Tax=Armillaria gallica TaxID=47427 RepID=A0A2H3EAP8_ARMGA|nr:hypothetical protein ARMGADRAFT_1005049 [Armillaria gallica]